jgi:hypothetical protein
MCIVVSTCLCEIKRWVDALQFVLSVYVLSIVQHEWAGFKTPRFVLSKNSIQLPRPGKKSLRHHTSHYIEENVLVVLVRISSRMLVFP